MIEDIAKSMLPILYYGGIIGGFITTVIGQILTCGLGLEITPYVLFAGLGMMAVGAILIGLGLLYEHFIGWH